MECSKGWLKWSLRQRKSPSLAWVWTGVVIAIPGGKLCTDSSGKLGAAREGDASAGMLCWISKGMWKLAPETSAVMAASMVAAMCFMVADLVCWKGLNFGRCLMNRGLRIFWGENRMWEEFGSFLWSAVCHRDSQKTEDILPHLVRLTEHRWSQRIMRWDGPSWWDDILWKTTYDWLVLRNGQFAQTPPRESPLTSISTSIRGICLHVIAWSTIIRMWAHPLGETTSYITVKDRWGENTEWLPNDLKFWVKLVRQIDNEQS